MIVTYALSYIYNWTTATIYLLSSLLLILLYSKLHPIPGKIAS